MKLLLPRKALKPRTFRLGAQQSILLGGAVRVDVVAAPAATIYLTVWACPEVVTHLGKTDAAADRSPAPPLPPGLPTAALGLPHELCCKALGCPREPRALSGAAVRRRCSCWLACSSHAQWDRWKIHLDTAL